MAESHVLALTPDEDANRAADRDYVTRRVRASGSSFFWAMRLLPPEKRDAIFAVYAYCREVDDIADGDLPLARKKDELNQWRAEIDRIYVGVPSRPIARALQRAVVRFGLERRAFLAVIDGMEMDANGPIRAPSMEELLLYCARVAGAVGELCVRIFGVPRAEGRALAASLGRALQLTNILRDLGEDAQLGRLYLPRELLQAHGILSAEPVSVLAHPRLPQACAALGVQARAAYAEAETIMAGLHPAAIRPARIMMEVYRRTLERMAAAGFAPTALSQNGLSAFMAKVGKLAIALRYALF